MFGKGLGAIVFDAKASNDIHVGFFITPSMIGGCVVEIVIGGWNNTRSALRFQRQGRPICWPMVSIEDPRIFISYWISIDMHKKVITTGHGRQVGASIIQGLTYNYENSDAPANAKYFGFSSWDSPVEIKNIEILDSSCLG